LISYPFSVCIVAKRAFGSWSNYIPEFFDLSILDFCLPTVFFLIAGLAKPLSMASQGQAPDEGVTNPSELVDS